MNKLFWTCTFEEPIKFFMCLLTIKLCPVGLTVLVRVCVVFSGHVLWNVLPQPQLMKSITMVLE